jgi:thiamine biosynthesis lipoprotein
MDAKRASFQAIGTRWDITLAESLPDAEWQQLLDTLRARIDQFDKVYSRFRSDSLVTQMAHAAGRYELPADAFALLKCYEALYRATNGRLTPLIGQVMVESGYDAAYSLQPKAGILQSPPRWEEVLSYDTEGLVLHQPALLDFGAAGKGYLVDLVSDVLQAAGHKSYLIDAGGDILHRSRAGDELKAGLENPFDTSEAIGVVSLKNQSLCASAGSKRRWAGWHHIIDPVSLTSPENVVATWVLADSTMLADGLATALFFTDPEILRMRFDFSYALLDADKGVRYAKDFPVTLFEEG